MAAVNIKHYFARVWENDAGPNISQPWRHDYTANILTFGIYLLLLNLATYYYLQAVQYVLLNNFPALADRWCHVKPGLARSKLEYVGNVKFVVGIITPFVGRFLYESLSARYRMHLWEWEMGMLAASLVGYGVVLFLVGLVAMLCRAGDKLNKVTGWQAQDDLRYHQGSSGCDGACWRCGQENPVAQSRTATAEQNPGGTREHHTKQIRSSETLDATKHQPSVTTAPANAINRVHGVLNGWSPVPKASKFPSPRLPSRKLLSPLPEHLSYRKKDTVTGQMEAYQTITATADYRDDSQEELRLKHYQQQEQQKEEAMAESMKAAMGSAQDMSTAWLRARQFATSIFSNSTSTAASRDSFGKSSIGHRGLLVSLDSENTTPLMERGTLSRDYT